MRKLYSFSLKLLFIICFFCGKATAQQHWFPSYLEHGRYVNDIHFFDTAHIVIAGGNESNDSLRDIFVSYNGGVTWNFSDNYIKPWVKSMAFKDSLNGYCVGFTGTLLKTTNGAVSWTQLPIPIMREFNKVVYLTPNVLLIAGGTKPGVANDTLQTILKSTDGGANWSVVMDRTGYWLKSMSFTDSLHGLAVGDNGTILKTIDGGNTWDTIHAPVNSNLNAVQMVSSNIAWAVGGSSFNQTILKSIDSGYTWTIVKDTLGPSLNDIFFLNSSKGYIAGNLATLLKTSNGGATWESETVDTLNPYIDFVSVRFANENYGIIGSSLGPIYIYSGTPSPSAITGGAYLPTDTSAIIQGLADTKGYAGTYRFYYSADSNFAFYFSTYPSPIQSNGYAVAQYTIPNMIKDTTYYYFFEVTTLGGIVRGDTMRFSTKKTNYVFQTLAASGITNGTAKLNGLINKFSTPVILSFEYGTSPVLGNTIAATPGSVNDSLLHTVYANVSGLQPNTLYYFRLKVETGAQLYYGDLYTFFTGDIYSSLQTLSPTNIQDSSVILNGYINKFRVPATLTFQFGTTTAMGSVVYAIPSSVIDTGEHYVSVQIGNLTPGTQYYYRIVAQTALGTYFGDMLTFNSTVGSGFFNTLYATNIYSTSATLNGVVNKIQNPLDMEFEYDTTETFTNPTSVVSTPPSISDTLLHTLQAAVTGLIPNHIYFFRLVGTNNTNSFYGASTQFFTSYPEIPNWDFQDWDTKDVFLPNNWLVPTDTVQRVPGHSGNYAIRISGRTFVMNGFISDKEVNGAHFLGGVPFTGQPDSVTVYVNYDIAPGDTAAMLVYLKKQSQELSVNQYAITGSSSGLFKRLSFPITYENPMPSDSIIVGFAPPSVFSENSTDSQSSLAIDDIQLQPGNLTFVNSNFENWYTSSVDEPRGWKYIKFAGFNPDNSDPKHMASKAYFYAPDDFAVKVNSIKILQYYISGKLSNGKILDERKGGFPVLAKHKTLNGYYKFLNPINDTMEINISMRKNGEEIGQATFRNSDSVSEFTPFNIPISDYSESVIPDSALISISSSTNHDIGLPGSSTATLYVDKLSFDGFYTGIKNNHNNSDEAIELDGIKVYPNPTRDYIIIDQLTFSNKSTVLSLLGMNGQLIRKINAVAGQAQAQMSIGDIAPGFYLLLIQRGDQFTSKKIVIQ